MMPVKIYVIVVMNLVIACAACACRKRPSDVDYLGKSKFMLNSGDYIKALEFVNKDVVDKGASRSNLILRIRIAIALGETAIAKSDLHTLLNMETRMYYENHAPEHLYFSAYSFGELGDYDRALSILQLISSRHPEFPLKSFGSDSKSLVGKWYNEGLKSIPNIRMDGSIR